MVNMRIARLIRTVPRRQFSTQSHTIEVNICGEKILFPRKKLRSNTAVLQALSDTVGHHAFAPKYEYMDDPNLIPETWNGRKIFAFAKMSGENAARWFVDKFPKVTESYSYEAPICKSYYPKLTEMPEDVNFETLERLVEEKSAHLAWSAWQKLSKKSEVPDVLTTKLLSLLCFSDNSEAPFVSTVYDYYTVTKGDVLTPSTQGTLAENSPAYTLFELIKHKNEFHYDSVIRAYTKDGNIVSAFERYAEMKTLMLIPTTSLINHLISLVSIRESDVLAQKALVKSLLADLKTYGHSVTGCAFEAYFEYLMGGSLPSDAVEAEVKLTLNEMFALRITPSLAALAQILHMNHKLEHDVFRSVLNEVQSKQVLRCEGFKDADFFIIAMELASKKDFQLMNDVYCLWRRCSNVVFASLADSDKFFQTFLLPAIKNLPTADDVMDVVLEIVPTEFSAANISTVGQLCSRLEWEDAFHHIPAVWNAILKRQNLIPHIFARLITSALNVKTSTEILEVTRSYLDYATLQQLNARQFKRGDPMKSRIAPGLMKHMLAALLNRQDHDPDTDKTILSLLEYCITAKIKVHVRVTDQEGRLNALTAEKPTLRGAYTCDQEEIGRSLEKNHDTAVNESDKVATTKDEWNFVLSTAAK